MLTAKDTRPLFMVHQILNGDKTASSILADWIEEQHYTVEACVYANKLRSQNNEEHLSVRFLYDVVLKFCTKPVKKQVHKEMRRAIKNSFPARWFHHRLYRQKELLALKRPFTCYTILAKEYTVHNNFKEIIADMLGLKKD